MDGVAAVVVGLRFHIPGWGPPVGIKLEAQIVARVDQLHECAWAFVVRHHGKLDGSLALRAPLNLQQ